MLLTSLVLAWVGEPAQPAIVTEPNVLGQPPAHSQLAVRVRYSSQAQLIELVDSLDVVEAPPQPGSLLALVTPTELAGLRAAGWPVTVDALQTGLLARLPELAAANGGSILVPPGYPCYRSVEELESWLDAVVAAHPDLTELIDIGDSWQKTQPGGNPGYDLWALVITNKAMPGPGVHGRLAGKPRFFLMAAIHARELTTPETAAFFVDYLLTNYGSDPDVTWLLDNREVHVVIMSNPDGHKMAEQGLFWRKNTDNDDGCTDPSAWGVDLNRNHSMPTWGGPGSSGSPCASTYRGPAPASEPEVQALQDYMTAIFPDPADDTGIMITLHSAGNLILWPWGDGTPTPAPDKPGLQAIGDKWASWNGYLSQSSNDLYPAAGASDDWLYDAQDVAGYTFEMGESQFQSCTDLPDIQQENLLPFLYAAKIAAPDPYQVVRGPETGDLALDVDHVDAGQPLLLSAIADDTDNGWISDSVFPIADPDRGLDVVAAEAYIDDWPEAGGVPIPLQPADGAWDAPGESLTGIVDTTGLRFGRHTLFVRSQDAGGHWGAWSAIFFWITSAPDFALSAPAALDLCAPGSAAGPVNVSSLLGYTQPVTLSLSGLPAGVSADFAPPMVTPPGVAQLTVTADSSPASGRYALKLLGAAADSVTHTLPLTLRVSNGLPAAPVPLLPVDGAADLPPAPTLAWSASAPLAAYRLQLALDPGFNVVLADYDALAGQSLKLAEPLLAGSTFYWRVQAVNLCGPGSWSAASRFSIRPQACLLLVDDDDQAPNVQGYYTAALDALGLPYDLFETEGGAGPDEATLAGFRNVVWFSGDARGSLTNPQAGPSTQDENRLAAYLDEGNRLLLSAQDYLHDRGLSSFAGAYLGVASFDGDGATGGALVGRTGDPIGDGLGSLPLAYPFGFSPRGDELQPAEAASAAFRLSNSVDYGVLDVAGAGWRSAFFGVSWLGLAHANPANGQAVLSRALDWFGACDPCFWADQDCDCRVSIGDVQRVSSRFGAAAGDPDYDVHLDENKDGAIDLLDVMMTAILWGQPPLACQ